MMHSLYAQGSMHTSSTSCEETFWLKNVYKCSRHPGNEKDIIINTLNNSFNSHSWWDEDRGDFFFGFGGWGGGVGVVG